MDFATVTKVLLDTLPLLLAGVSTLGIMYYFTRHPDSKYSKYVAYVVQACKVAEKFTSTDPKFTKVDVFLKEFTDLYAKEEGKPLPDAVKVWAMRAKEIVLLELDKVKASKVTAVTTSVTTSNNVTNLEVK